jgi:recombination protein RecR
MTVIDRLINNISKLPGLGKKSASRIVYFMLKADNSFIQELSKEIRELKELITNCKICGNFTDINPCNICCDTKRDKKSICVVEEPKDIVAIELTHEYSGIYHVLMGAISPIEGIGPHELRMEQLFNRIETEEIHEVIIATNPTIEGETTAQYIINKINISKIKASRLALGLPVGGALEYADSITLGRAFRGRKIIE